MSPDKVGRYKIKSELGRSGMATVYRAFDPVSKREVAIKILPRQMMDNLVTRARFKREIRLIAKLEHPAIVPVYDVGGEDDHQPFFVMRYMSGGSLTEMIQKRRFSLRDAAVVLERLASALDHAHSQGIIHRDIKPDNVLFDASNNPYLSDFGVAKFTESLISSTNQEVIGTPAYLSPEQALGEDVDPRADIYGLGAMLYEMLTGERPFGKETVIGLALQHVNDPVPNVLKLRPELPGEVDVIIKRAMAKNRENRYNTALEFAHELNKVAYEGEPTLQKIPALVDRQTVSSSASSRAGWIVAGLILLLVGGAYVFREQLPFLSPPVSAPTMTVIAATEVPASVTPAPSQTSVPETTPTIAATVTVETPVVEVPAFPGGADKVAFLAGNQLYLMDVDGSNLIQVRTDNSAKTELQWLPDGRLTYISRNCIYWMDLEDRQPQKLMCFVANELLEDFEVSPDGKLVAISVERTLNILPFDFEVLQDIDSRFSLLTLRENCFYNQYAFREVLWSESGTQIAAHVVDTELVSSDQVFLLNIDIPNCDTVGPVRVAKIPGTNIAFEGESTKRITSYDWDGDHLFLLNDSIRNEGFGNLYVYNSQTREGLKINPIHGECCYRDARWSPDKTHIFFVFQRFGGTEIEFYYIPYAELGDGNTWTPIPNLDTLFPTSREKPQPELRPAQ
ncbi:MAG TPA: protein kinase [Anaerolineales bacterium]|jgi:serine/threonine-protein kinase|nr:protein kinase [Anaerolineales bacterium]